MATAHKIGTILLKIATVLLFFWLIGFLIGCGSKKKLTQKSQFETEVAIVEKQKETENKETKTEAGKVEKKETETKKESEDFTAEVDDPSKPASVKKTEKDGETTWDLSNIKNFNAGSKNETSKSKDSIGQNLSKIDKSNKTTDSETKTDIDASGSERNTDSERTGGIPWWLIAVLYAVVSFIRKSLNPLKWI